MKRNREERHEWKVSAASKPNGSMDWALAAGSLVGVILIFALWLCLRGGSQPKERDSGKVAQATADKPAVPPPAATVKATPPIQQERDTAREVRPPVTPPAPRPETKTPVAPPPVQTVVAPPPVAAPPAPPKVKAEPRAPPAEPAEPEPRYESKTARQWMAELKSNDPGRRFRALVAFRFLPPQPQETLDEILRCLESPDRMAQEGAVLALVPYGPRAKVALPRLIEMLGDKMATLGAARAAMQIMGSMGTDAKDAVPVLLQRLRSRSTVTPAPEAEALCRIGTPEGIEAVVQHIDFTSFKNGHIAPFIEALGYAGEAALPQLLRWLENPPMEYGRPALASVFKALAKVGPQAKPAAALLVKHAQSKANTFDANWARFALLHIAPEQLNDAKDIPVLVQQAGHSSTIPDPADATLVAYGRRAVPEIVKALAAPPSNSYALLNVLEKMKTEGREAIPVVTGIARDPGNKLRGAALRALGPMGLPTGEWVPMLTEALSDPGARSSAATALRLIGSLAQSALPELRKYKDDTNENARREVRDALNRIEAEAASMPVAPPPVQAEF
jgi:HEAT repeat protein